MSNEQGRFVWYDLTTTDPAAAKAFYSHVVGWTTEDVPMPGGTYTLLKVDGIQVGGITALPTDGQGRKPSWSGYVTVADVDASARSVQKLGGSICLQATDIPNVGRFAVVADPQGARFNLFKAARSGQPPPPPTQPARIGWHELHASDWKQAWTFYSELLGWRKGDAMDMGAMGTYQLFTVGDVAVGGMFNSPAASSERYWLYYARVGGIDAAAERATTSGGKICHGPVEVPGGDWIVQANDPQGAAFALVGPRG
jgi:predicted enzyme related to lactoylglutathione lyase